LYWITRYVSLRRKALARLRIAVGAEGISGRGIETARNLYISSAAGSVPLAWSACKINMDGKASCGAGTGTFPSNITKESSLHHMRSLADLGIYRKGVPELYILDWAQRFQLPE
jgi:hypothetical protein